MKPMAAMIHDRLHQLGDGKVAESSRWFFKTGPGEYGEGDHFIGLRAPQLRQLAREYRGVTIADALSLLRSPVHEARSLALLILVGKFDKEKEARKQIYQDYLTHTKFINNWDLVDVSAPHIVGAHLSDKDRRPLYKLAKSRSLWERRISIVATAYFIRREDFGDTLAISKVLLSDREDLIHKAVGWMLREVGKRSLPDLENFLREHCRVMPRTMLRYAIERLPEVKRQRYLRGEV
jgi:3-methyladenine DNA glycosylase AlkD